eukprot:3196548-Prorocentrum_lima.AAC.1
MVKASADVDVAAVLVATALAGNLVAWRLVVPGPRLHHRPVGRLLLDWIPGRNGRIQRNRS